jgi:hypothetical protein
MNWLYEEFRAIYMNVRLGILIWIKKPMKRKESPRIEVIHGVNKKSLSVSGDESFASQEIDQIFLS